MSVNASKITENLKNVVKNEALAATDKFLSKLFTYKKILNSTHTCVRYSLNAIIVASFICYFFNFPFNTTKNLHALIIIIDFYLSAWLLQYAGRQDTTLLSGYATLQQKLAP